MNSVVKPIASFLASAKILNPKCCSIEQDNHLKAPVIRLKGEVDKTRIQIPKEDRPLSALQLTHSLVAMQIFLSSSDHFAVEFTVSQSLVVRTKLIIGTSIKEAHLDSTEGNTCCKLPLIIPRNKWVQVIIHVAGIVTGIFALPNIKTIDGIALMGTAKIRGVSTTNSEQDSIDSTPAGMTLFAVPAYVPPIWTTATKEETTDQKGTSPETGSPPSTVRNGDVAADAGPTDTGNAAGVNPANKLPVITRRPSAPDSVSAKAPAPTNAAPPARSSTEATASKSSARQNGAPYIRFVDKTNDAPPTGLKPNTNAMKKGDGARERATTSGNVDVNKFDVSSWEEPSSYVEVFDTAALAVRDGEMEEKRVPRREQPSGGPDERVQRITAARRGRSDASLPQPRKRSNRPPNSDVPSPTNAARRQQRAKTRTQILKANDQIINKYVVERARLASQVPLNNTPSVADSVILTDEHKQTEPICGYGFGYMGLMHENGSYENEEGDPTLKGVLMLNVDSDDAGE